MTDPTPNRPIALPTPPRRRRSRPRRERPGKYAAGTSVPVARSEAEAKRILARYGVSEYGIWTGEAEVILQFVVNKRVVKWSMPLPSKAAYRTTAEYEAEVRRRHRVLCITVKSLLEAIESKILTFDAAFLSHLLIEGTGRTLGEMVIPKLDTGLRALVEENPTAP